MPEQLLTWDEAVDFLTELGCEEVNQEYANETIWKTPWGYHFTIPHLGPEKLVPRFVLLNTLDSVRKTMPK